MLYEWDDVFEIDLEAWGSEMGVHVRINRGPLTTSFFCPPEIAAQIAEQLKKASEEALCKQAS